MGKRLSINTGKVFLFRWSQFRITKPVFQKGQIPLRFAKQTKNSIC
jgi:hypothetical protein